MTTPMFDDLIQIRGLTLWEPWATAIAIGIKTYETRSWGTRYRGSLAIHAGRTVDQEVLKTARDFYPGFPDPSPGMVLCVVQLNECRTMTEPPSDDEAFWGVFGVGRWAWKMTGLMKLEEPIPMIGHQGLYGLDPDVATALTEAGS